MSELFDPYYTWLGIAPKDQPPTYYRLLGLDRFESNPDVIDHAADRQMAHLRSLQSGRRAAECQQLLNEVSAARICLLDAFKKSQYDDRLRADELRAKRSFAEGPIAQGARPTQAPTVPVPLDDSPLPKLAPPEEIPGADARLAQIAVQRRRRRRRRLFFRAVVAGIVFAGVAAAVANLAPELLNLQNESAPSELQESGGSESLPETAPAANSDAPTDPNEEATN